MTQPRVLFALAGDIQRQAHARIKYGLFVDALARQGVQIIPYDTTLHGLDRVLMAARVFHPNRHIWRERFWKNIPAFEARSRHLADNILRQKNLDLVLHIVYQKLLRHLHCLLVKNLPARVETCCCVLLR
jgi:hypothetical protein